MHDLTVRHVRSCIAGIHFSVVRRRLRPCWISLACCALAGACAADPPVSCGAGTHRAGSTCVPTVDASVETDGSTSSRDAGAGGDAREPSADATRGSLDDGAPCPVDSSGNVTLRPGCDGDELVYCRGTRVSRTDCTELGDRCVPGTSDEALARCDGGVYGPCDAQSTLGTCADAGHSLLCGASDPNAIGYTYTLDCAAFGDGYSCRMGATEAGCVPPGTVPCETTAPESACTLDRSGLVRCIDGLAYTDRCEDRLAGSVCDLGPDDEAVCVPPGAARCQPSTFHGSCLSERLLESCDRSTAHVAATSCDATTRCRVSALGFAACVPDEARDCDPATHVPRCFDENRLAICDVHGFESSLECFAGGGMRCIPDIPARCGTADRCDESSYAAHCDGQVALNCRVGGWVETTTCPDLVPCRVREGVAACGG